MHEFIEIQRLMLLDLGCARKKKLGEATIPLRTKYEEGRDMK
uniref:Uncharacterized protein n=1 Tax=Manihot esculenta TaxID=3983 RepID=A0A2C9ULX5_MANES